MLTKKQFSRRWVCGDIRIINPQLNALSKLNLGDTLRHLENLEELLHPVEVIRAVPRCHQSIRACAKFPIRYAAWGDTPATGDKMLWLAASTTVRTAHLET